MKILALADIHGGFDVMEIIVKNEPGVDVVVVAGDLTTNGTGAEAEKAIRILQQYGKPVVAVCGNMDPPDLDERLADLGVSINGKGVLIGVVGFCGVSAAPHSFLHTPNEISEEIILERAERGWRDLDSATRRVFVPHAPPFGVKVDKVLLGKHAGSSAVRIFIEKHQPDVTVCGHIHEGRGQDSIGATLIINCGTAARGYYGVIEIGEDLKIENKSAAFRV